MSKYILLEDKHKGDPARKVVACMYCPMAYNNPDLLWCRLERKAITPKEERSDGIPNWCPLPSTPR